MAKTRIGINGFGRIGRHIFKIAFKDHADQLEVVAVNDLFDVETNVHLLKHDTVYGKFPGEVEAKDGDIVCGDWHVKNFAERNPADIPWRDLGVDIVIESTGIFRTGPTAKMHLDAGAKKVIITAPAKEEDITIVLGVNEGDYDPDKHHIVSNASCTTNCLAPAANVIHNAFGIEKGAMTTVHAYTNDQRILDLPHRDPRRARAAACNIIPTSTGAAKALALVIPDLKGKVDGFSLRVPTPTVSIVDFTCELQTKTDTEELKKALREAAEGPLKGILGYNTEPLVSSDFEADSRSSIIESDYCYVQDGNLAKIVSWYDNEYGYSSRVCDLACLMADKGL